MRIESAGRKILPWFGKKSHDSKCCGVSHEPQRRRQSPVFSFVCATQNITQLMAMSGVRCECKRSSDFGGAAVRPDELLHHTKLVARECAPTPISTSIYMRDDEPPTSPRDPDEDAFHAHACFPLLVIRSRRYYFSGTKRSTYNPSTRSERLDAQRM